MSLRDFSDSDMQILKEIVLEHRRRTNPSTDADQPYYTDQAPEVYVAKLPDDGIPARVGLEPGYAECDIYKQRVVSFGSDQTELILLTEPNGDPYKQFIRNLETTVLTGEYITVKRDKYGFWMPSAGGGTACDFIRFQILSADLISTPRSAQVAILSRPCGCETVEEEIPDSLLTGTGTGTGTGEAPITVYDMAGCFLNEPEDDLIGRVGYAKYMIDESYLGQGTGTGTGGGPDEIDDCNWEIVSLCCPSC